jgi:hypothetical protein
MPCSPFFFPRPLPPLRDDASPFGDFRLLLGLDWDGGVDGTPA